LLLATGLFRRRPCWRPTRKRQLEGIAKAKAVGVYKGRPASIDVDQARKLKAEGVGASEIAKALNIGRASVYRVLGAAPSPLPAGA
jgi:DNA invertase Pin-like site-specific DNA recombinase